MAVVNRIARKKPRSAAGTLFTREYEERLAAESEAGFDPAELTPRYVGRPSLTGRPGRSQRLDLCVDDRTFAALRALAAREERSVSDVVREALRRYLTGELSKAEPALRTPTETERIR